MYYSIIIKLNFIPVELTSKYSNRNTIFSDKI